MSEATPRDLHGYHRSRSDGSWACTQNVQNMHPQVACGVLWGTVGAQDVCGHTRNGQFGVTVPSMRPPVLVLAALLLGGVSLLAVVLAWFIGDATSSYAVAAGLVTIVVMGLTIYSLPAARDSETAPPPRR